MSEYGYPKAICYECKEKSGNWCKKFKMPLQLALQTMCGYGFKMSPKKKEEENE